MQVDAEEPLVCFPIRIQLAVSVHIAPDFDWSRALTQGLILLAMEVDLPDARVVTRTQDGGALDVRGMLQPIESGVGRCLPTVDAPFLRVAVCTADEIVESIRLPAPLSDADDVQVILATENWIPQRFLAG
tara:strand:+ start:2030 stop:2422 length:393 start_codon:yes stop_codon:yes gene_type:complete